MTTEPCVNCKLNSELLKRLKECKLILTELQVNPKYIIELAHLIAKCEVDHAQN